MNLFENIFDKFTKQAQPQVPFGTPQAPRTSSYVAPNVPTTTTPKIAQGVRNGGFAPGYEGTVDETKGSFFQGLQGVQNVFNELPKALEATAQSGKKQFEQEMSAKRQSFISDMLAQGYKKEDIFKAMDNLQAQGEFDFNPGIAGNIVGGIGERLGSIGETTSKLSQIDNPLDRTVAGVLPYAGQTVATALQPITSAIEPYVSPVVQKIVQETNQTERLQDWSNQWSQFEKTNPILAENIAGLLNVSQIAPLPKVGSIVKTGTSKTIKSVTPDLGKMSKKLISSSDEAFRKQAEDIAVPKLSEMGFRDKQKVAGDAIETKPGLFKKEELVRSPQEALAIEEVSRMLKEGKIKKGGTELQKSIAINDEITGLAEALKGRLNNTQNPVNITKQEVETFINDLATNVKKNPIMVGDMQESAFKIIQNIKDKLTKDSYTPAELLEIRKQLDADIKAFKGETVFDPKIENAFSSTLREFRQGINNKVAELVPDADVRNFLDRQSALYNAKDNVDLKWSKQANTTVGRVLSKIQSATGIPRTEIIELTTALGLLGASSIAPIVAPIAIGATTIAGGRKAVGAILSPKNKVKLAKILTKLDEAIKKNPNDTELLKAKQLLTKKNVGNTTNSSNNSNNGLSNSQSVKKPTVKPNSTTNAKQQVIKPTSSDTIPEGYFKNAFGEIQKNPSNKKGGFIKIPEIGKKSIVKSPDSGLIEEARKYKSAEEFMKFKITPPKEKVYLYRGMSQKFDPKFDLGKTDAPIGYSTWTDNLKLAEQYAGENGFVYKIELPKSKLGKEIIDKDGERTLFFNNEKKAGLNNVSGDEYLIYNYHDDYSPNLIKQTQTEAQLNKIYEQANKPIKVPEKKIVKPDPLIEEARNIPKMNKGQEDLFKKDYGDFIDLELELKKAIKQGIPKKEVIKKIKYIERAVSEDEYKSIIKNGYIQSNSNKNFSNQLGDTYYHTEGKGTSFYLPENGGYIVKIKVKPEHNIDINEVGEVFTNKKIPISDIIEIQGGKGIVKIK